VGGGVGFKTRFFIAGHVNKTCGSKRDTSANAEREEYGASARTGGQYVIPYVGGGGAKGQRKVSTKETAIAQVVGGGGKN